MKKGCSLFSMEHATYSVVSHGNPEKDVRRKELPWWLEMDSKHRFERRPSVCVDLQLLMTVLNGIPKDADNTISEPRNGFRLVSD